MSSQWLGLHGLIRKDNDGLDVHLIKINVLIVSQSSSTSTNSNSEKTMSANSSLFSVPGYEALTKA